MPAITTDHSERLWGRGLHALGFVVTVAVAAGLSAVLYFPLQSREADLDGKLAAAWKLLGDSETISQQHAEARAALDTAEERIRTIREQIPETAQEAQFKAQLGRLAEEVDFQVHDYRPGAAEPHDFCQQIRVSVRGRGDYASLCRFVAGLDGLPRLCRTTGLAIDSTRAAEGTYAVEMTLTIFFGVRQDALDAAKEKRRG